MTPPPRPDLPFDDDELDADEIAVHAVFDDEADADQRRRVASDPLLLTRLGELRAVADRVAAPPTPLPPALFDRLRTAALDRFDVVGVGGGAAPPSDGDDHPSSAEDEGRAPGATDHEVIGSGATVDGMGPAGDELVPVRPLAPRRSRRPPARRLPPLPAVAAVVIVLMALGVSLLLAGRGRDEDLTAASGRSAKSDSAAEQEEALSADGSVEVEDTEGDVQPAAEERETSAGAAPEEGKGDVEDADDVDEVPVPAFADEAALRDALQRVDPDSLVLDGSEAPAPGTSAESSDDPAAAARARSADPDAQRCSDVLQASDPAIGPTTAAAAVTVDGEERLVLTNEVTATADEPAATQLTVFDPVGCVPRLAVRR